MKVTFLGDLHGKKERIFDYTKNVIQVGDLDLYDYGWWSNNFSEKEELENFHKEYKDKVKLKDQYLVSDIEKGTRYFIDGNHDFFPFLDNEAIEPYYVLPNLVHIPRGYVSEKTMFIGGGESIDRKRRIKNVNWFSEERFSLKQEKRILDYKGTIDVIVSHDLPYCAAAIALTSQGNPVGFYSTMFLQKVWEKFRPSLWIAGHFHMDLDFEIISHDFLTRFVVCNIGQKKEFDVPIKQDFFTKKWSFKKDI